MIKIKRILEDERVQKIADTSILALVSRLAQVIGIPVGLFFGGWLVHNIENVQSRLTSIEVKLADKVVEIQGDVAVLDGRILRIEDERIDNGFPRRVDQLEKDVRELQK